MSRYIYHVAGHNLEASCLNRNKWEWKSKLLWDIDNWTVCIYHLVSFSNQRSSEALHQRLGLKAGSSGQWGLNKKTLIKKNNSYFGALKYWANFLAWEVRLNESPVLLTCRNYLIKDNFKWIFSKSQLYFSRARLHLGKFNKSFDSVKLSEFLKETATILKLKPTLRISF